MRGQRKHNDMDSWVVKYLGLRRFEALRKCYSKQNGGGPFRVDLHRECSQTLVRRGPILGKNSTTVRDGHRSAASQSADDGSPFFCVRLAAIVTAAGQDAKPTVKRGTQPTCSARVGCFDATRSRPARHLEGDSICTDGPFYFGAFDAPVRRHVPVPILQGGRRGGERNTKKQNTLSQPPKISAKTEQKTQQKWFRLAPLWRKTTAPAERKRS